MPPSSYAAQTISALSGAFGLRHADRSHRDPLLAATQQWSVAQGDSPSCHGVPASLVEASGRPTLSLPTAAQLGLPPSPRLYAYAYASLRPTANIDPTGLGGHSACEAYAHVCRERPDSYACRAHGSCLWFGEGEWQNCVRDCLLEYYLPDDTFFGEVPEHAYCFTRCFGREPEYPWDCPPYGLGA